MQQIRHEILGAAVRAVCGSAGTGGIEGRDQGKRERDVGEVLRWRMKVNSCYWEKGHY